jgi:hypothetical protein
VRDWIGQLSEKQRLVIRHRYGIDECEVQTLEELADSLELTRERVRQIQLEALGQLRRIIKRRGSPRTCCCSSCVGRCRFHSIPRIDCHERNPSHLP